MRKIDYQNIAKNFEESRLDFNENRVKTFKMIAFLGVAFGVLSLIALIVALPFKTIEPIVLRVNEVTGDTEIITTMTEKVTSMEEAIDKFNISRYVKAREGYYFDLIQTDFNLVRDQTNSTILPDFIARYEGKNGRAEVLKDRVTITPAIRSISLGDSNGAKFATIRLTLARKDLQTLAIQNKHMIVTMSYDYNNTEPMSEAQRLINPFGFLVTTYRVDVDNE